jgi:hypothetical protein
MNTSKNITLSVGLLSFTEQGDFSILFIETQGVVIGSVMARKVEIVSKLSKSSCSKLITLNLRSVSDIESSNFSINADDFKLLAKHLPANQIDDRLNILGDQEKGAFVATDQVTTKAILLNDMNTTIG